MGAYILRRLLLMIPTMFGIMAVSFLVVQFAPGGPVEEFIASMQGQNVSALSRVTGSEGGDFSGLNTLPAGENASAQTQDRVTGYRGSRGLRPEVLAQIEKQFGFDKPPVERFFTMLWNYLRFDFGESYQRGVPVVDLILQKLPVSITLGLWMTLISYGISIPLGIAKAVRDGSRFDVWTSSVIIVGYALPGFLVAVLLIVLFAGGTFLDLFPFRGLTSDNWASLPWWQQILDYLWHITLPIIAMALGAFATMTLLTKNSFLDEIRKQYVVTARAKGLSERQVLYRHVFRNAMLLLIASFPAAFISAFFGGSLLIETIFSLDGLGLLGFQSVLSRDYSVVFATLYIFSLMGLIIGLVSDLMYMWIDPRIDFDAGGLMRLAFAGVTPFLAYEPADAVRSAPLLSPINQRRLRNFKANRRGYWSLILFAILFVLTLFAEAISNDKPLVVSYRGEILFPVVVDYPESKFGGFLAVTQYRDKFIADEINANGWMIWPPVRYSYRTTDEALSVPAPSAPSWLQTTEVRCERYPAGVEDPDCTLGNWHWLGTDDQGRDVLARVIYGFRISVLFGLILTIASSVIGVVAGALQGYLGGWVDLIAQRLIEIWTSIPALYLLLIISSVLAPSFFVLLGILLLFSWVTLVGVVRAEFLRGRNFEYVAAARALGVSNGTIMWRHLLPNAMVATLTFMPFILGGSITTLTSLDFLGYGLPVGSPSLGELLAQGKNNLTAPWLGITGFLVISIMLSLLVFIGEAVRDAFDPRKTFA